ncbi:MAG: hypothetical protein CVV31_02525 [Methanomicrobiales archaeon HGW-Methanomicrobiales-2]|jgi:hypothetical protein|nr:MAG: hypothetical protein CVV31_02525 [Methanomicrobiales archaeon HGW-Methanomicrobiales-2]
MKGRNLLLLILLTAAVVAGGCTAPETTAPNTQPTSPTPSPTPEEAMGAGQPAPTPAGPVRGDQTPQKVDFVDPQTYHLPTPTPTITMTKLPDDLRVSGQMVKYAVVTCDHPPRVLATEVYHIPYPYWDLNVSVTPMNEYPWLVIEVRDPEDPNRVVKEVRYSRGDILYAGNDTTRSTSVENSSIEKRETFTIRDGYGDYYFVIRSESLKSLNLTVLVPEKYLV